MGVEIIAEELNEGIKAAASEGGFTVDVSGDELWEFYLDAFPEGTNEVFRERREYDCSSCRQFVKGIGGLVYINEEYEVISIWRHAREGGHHLNVVADKMAAFVESKAITGIYRTKERQYSSQKNSEVLDSGEVVVYHHLYAKVPREFVVDSVGATVGAMNNNFGVVKRGFNEITPEALGDVIELIEHNSIYRGEQYLAALKTFQKAQQDYQSLSDELKDNFIWANANNGVLLLKNSAIGKLLMDVSEGTDLDIAVRAFETMVAPQNYQRTKSVITKGMVQQATKKLDELGLRDALDRRMATPEDVSVNNVLFANRSTRGVMRDAIEDMLMDQVVKKPLKIENLQEININDFIEKILPKLNSLEVCLEPKQIGHLMTVTAPVYEDAPKLFNWDNGFSWAYRGGVTDSIRERVKKAGGNVNAKYRVSLSWFNTDDLDIHAQTPTKHIFYGERAGVLDVDMNVSPESREAVENLSWDKLPEGKTKVWVNNYNKRESVDVGFDIEVSIDGVSTIYSYEKAVPNGKNVNVLTINKKGSNITFDVEKHMKPQNRPVTEWGITTGEFTPVNMVMLSPNYWDGQESNGNKHWFFILDGCKNDEKVRGFFNEYLRPELKPNRKVFEVLADKMMCEPTNNQLSGVGFSSTINTELVVRVGGEGLDGNPTMKIIF